MKKTRLVLFFCLIFTFLTLIPNCVFAAGNDLIDDISNMFVPKKEYHQQQKVILGGIPVGISLNNDCVEIVGFSQIIADEGAFSPACDAGLQIGDKITHINGQKITKTEQISQFAENSKILKVSFLRNGQKNQTEIYPKKDVLTEKYRLGMWLRDQSFGIGTLTFVKDGCYFASLGHPITSKNGDILEIVGGKVHDCNIIGVNKGLVGDAGELKGTFNNQQFLGQIFSNNKFGVYGKFDQMPNALDCSKEIEVANPDEIKPGKAQIYSTIDGNQPQLYEIEIIKVKNANINEEKGLVIKVTDKNLLSKTGGIVQGMSGSPIIQNEKLVGAVTHVFINDPTRGYGVLIQNMMNAAE